MTNPASGYQVLARRWRPQNFEELIGQEHVVRALVNGLDNDRLHHAFVFTGTRGVGKTTIARILAKSLNCEQGVSSKPCGECGACVAIKEGRFVDLIEVDAASKTGVDDMRELLANVQYAPSSGRYKVYLIDEVHMLSASSFNALLKTLEEPPEHVKFLFATTDPEKLPVTVLSRCLQFNLKHLEADQIVSHLSRVLDADGINADSEALSEIGRAAQGSVRDALSILDQAIAYGAGTLKADEVHSMLGTLERGRVGGLLELVCDGDAEALMAAVDDLAQYGPNYQRVLQDLGDLLHRAAIAQRVPGAVDPARPSTDLVTSLAARLAPETVQLYYEIIVRGLRDLAYAPTAKAGLEMTLLRILAFQPSSAGAMTPAAPSPATARAAPSRSAAAARSSATSAKAAPSARSHAPSSPPPAVAEESVKPPPQPANEAPSEPLPPIDPKTWTDRVGQLALSPTARELASNCELLSDDGDHIVLRLPPKLQHFRTPGNEKKLEQGLSISLGRQIALRIVERDGDGATPTAQREQGIKDRHEAANQAIAGDPNVLAMQETMGARILPNTTKPIDGESK